MYCIFVIWNVYKSIQIIIIIILLIWICLLVKHVFYGPKKAWGVFHFKAQMLTLSLENTFMLADTLFLGGLYNTSVAKEILHQITSLFTLFDRNVIFQQYFGFLSSWNTILCWSPPILSGIKQQGSVYMPHSSKGMFPQH